MLHRFFMDIDLKFFWLDTLRNKGIKLEQTKKNTFCKERSMFRNQYDTDITTWSPAGRLHQVEYAMEAVKQGSAAVGLKSKNFSVLASLKRYCISNFIGVYGVILTVLIFL